MLREEPGSNKVHLSSTSWVEVMKQRGLLLFLLYLPILFVKDNYVVFIPCRPM